MQRLKAERGMAIIVIEHRLEGLAALSDGFLFMDKGRMVAVGATGEIGKRYVPGGDKGALLYAGRRRQQTLVPKDSLPFSP